jgi:2-keto-4-pentenoate hydratase/2-oxohepta-3-ene-1,7-dioic acid hydratase in catechol pathway
VRLATVEVQGFQRVVGVTAGREGDLIDIARAASRHELAPRGFPGDMIDLLDSGSFGSSLLRQLDELAASGADMPVHAADSVVWRAPIPRPRKIVAAVANKPDVELRQLKPGSGGRWPRPLYFLKAPTGVVGPNESVLVPPGIGIVQPEAELCLVVGREAKSLTREESRSCLAGVCVINDITAVTLSWQDAIVVDIPQPDGVEEWPMRPMGRYKGVDTFAPCGPWITPLHEAGRLEDLALTLRYNSQVIQHGSVGDYRYSVDEVVAEISQLTRLEPGDLIAMGSTRQAEGWPLHAADLSDGGVIEVEGTGLGSVRNPIAICA